MPSADAAPGLVAHARQGYCRPTKAFSAGSCVSGSEGTWPLQGATPLASCLQRCAEECTRCRYVSFSVSRAECDWFHDCNMQRLSTQFSVDHQTIAVASLWADLKPSLTVAPRQTEAPLCDDAGRRCVRVVAYDTENSDMYPPERGAAGQPMPFGVHFVYPPSSLRPDATMTQKLQHKFTAFQEYAATAPDDHILFFIDARDIVWGGCPPQSLGERFESMNRSVVFGAELGCFPLGPYCNRYPATRSVERKLVDCDFTCSDPPAYQHLNSGFVAARTPDARAFFSLYVDAFVQRSTRGVPQNPDQTISSMLFVRHHEALRYGLDWEARLSLQLHRMKRRSLSVDPDGSVRSHLFGGELACFVHFNGGSKFMQTLLRRSQNRTARGGGSPAQTQIKLAHAALQPFINRDRRRGRSGEQAQKPRQLPLRTHVGYCDTAEGPGNCDSGKKGSWQLGASEASDLRTARMACQKRCEACANCRYVSYSILWNDCSWFSLCDLEALQRKVRGFRTLPVRAVPDRELVAFRERERQQARVRRAAAAAAERRFAGDASGDTVPRRSAASLAMWSCAPRIAVQLALGVMTALPRHSRREEIRHVWPPHPDVAACFVVSRWLKDSSEGTLMRNDQTFADQASADMLVLETNSSEIEGGTAAFKMLPWISHAVAAFRSARYIARADDDVYLELPALVATAEDLSAARRDGAFLLGSIHSRAFWSRATRSIYVNTEPRDADGPFAMANGQFLALSARAARALHACRSAHEYISELLHLSSGPFVSTADDGLLGYLLHLCLLRDSLHTIMLPFRAAHDIRCSKVDGPFGRPPSTASVVIHKLKMPGSICYAQCARAGAPAAIRPKCCMRFACACANI